MEEWGSRRVEERLEFEGESREHFVIAVDEAVVKRSS
jgi:sulfur carrier protein ThiS